METDYSQIAPRYDRNTVRRKEVDTRIGELLKQNGGDLKVLDLACGTGKYLKLQSDHYREASVEWLGADRSEEMLAVSRSKGINAQWKCCDADDPGIAPDGSLDYIRNEYAWHHFTNHTEVIRNISRMLKPGALFTMINICPEYMRKYWVYHYFPGTREIDARRFIECGDLLHSFNRNGFDTRIRIKTVITEANYPKILKEAENRDISQLTLIGDREYAEGICRIREDMESRTGAVHDMAFLELTALKQLLS